MSIKVNPNGTCHIEGREFPIIGFGTYPLKNKVCFQAVADAGKAGYRIIDTATFYDNFTPIGRALKMMGRHNFYLISKVWPDSQSPERLRRDLENTLTKLQTPYLDAYLVHWPNSRVPIEDTLRAMEELRVKGKIRHIGLSNVTVNHLKRALEVGVPITWVQIEMNPFFYDAELLAFCRAHGIGVQAWAPLGRGGVQEDPLLKRIGERHGKTPAQVALRWIIQHGVIPLPGSQNTEHIKQNFAAFDFTLSDSEMESLNTRAQAGKRTRLGAGMGFADEFDFSYEQCWPKN